MVLRQKHVLQLLQLAIVFRLFQERLKPAETTRKNTDREKANEFGRIRCPLCKWRSKGIEPLVLRRLRLPGVLLRRLRHGVEYVYDARPLPRLPPSMALDNLLALPALVTARRLV